jgi:hypothetical protein
MVSMSSRLYPISSGPTKAGTHNSSMAQRSWRCSFYLVSIRSRRVDEMEFQCRLAHFVISNTGEMRCELTANLNEDKRDNMIHSDETWEHYHREGGAPDGECCVEKRSTTKGVGEAQNEREDGHV